MSLQHALYGLRSQRPDQLVLEIGYARKETERFKVLCINREAASASARRTWRSSAVSYMPQTLAPGCLHKNSTSRREKFVTPWADRMWI